MSQITVEKLLDLPSDRIWPILADFGGIHRFHPRVERSPIVNDQPTGEGAQRVCHFYDGSSVKEELVGVREGESVRIKIIEGSIPLNDVVATISLHAVDASSTRVVFNMDYTPKYGPLGSLMNAAMIRPKFRKILLEVLDGLQTHAKTGATVGKNGVLKPAAAAA